MRRIRWPFWAALGTVTLAWLLTGVFLPDRDFPANDLFNVGAVAAFFSSLLFIGVYTVRGLAGPAKWWKTNLGTYLVLAVGALAVLTGTPAFAVLFNHGMIDTHWWAWIWIGAHYLAAAMVLLLVLLLARNPENGNGGRT